MALPPGGRRTLSIHSCVLDRLIANPLYSTAAAVEVFFIFFSFSSSPGNVVELLAPPNPPSSLLLLLLLLLLLFLLFLPFLPPYLHVLPLNISKEPLEKKIIFI